MLVDVFPFFTNPTFGRERFFIQLFMIFQVPDNEQNVLKRILQVKHRCTQKRNRYPTETTHSRDNPSGFLGLEIPSNSFFPYKNLIPDLVEN